MHSALHYQVQLEGFSSKHTRIWKRFSLFTALLLGLVNQTVNTCSHYLPWDHRVARRLHHRESLRSSVLLPRYRQYMGS